MENTQPTGGHTDSGEQKPQSPPWMQHPPQEQEPEHRHDHGGDNGHDHESRSTRSATTYIVAAIVIIAILVIANLDKDTLPDNDGANEAVGEQSEELDGALVTIDNLIDAVERKDFEQLDRAEQVINSSQGKPLTGTGSERLVSGVADSENSNMVYFSTVSYSEDLNESFVGIYHFNTLSNRWQRVYKTTYTDDELSDPAFLRVIGRLGDRLVLFKDKRERPPEDCFSYYTLAENEPYETLLLSLENPYAGFEQFSVPDTLKQREQKKISECLTR